MRKIKWWCDNGFVGAEHEGEIELSDDYTDEEIDDYVYEEVMSHISWGWEEVK
jgi:hypothetical protein